MILPAVLLAPRSLNPDGGVPTDDDCAVWNTTFRACPPGGSLCIMWAAYRLRRWARWRRR